VVKAFISWSLMSAIRSWTTDPLVQTRDPRATGRIVMASPDTEVQSCSSCGASIYPEALQNHKAGRVGERLLCKICMKEVVASGQAASPVGEGDTPIAFDEEDLEAPGPESSQIRSIGSVAGITFGSAELKEDFERPLAPNARNATRCRTFHSKLNDASMAHMNDLINEWVDSNEDITIKFVSTNVGIVEGKHSDPHLIVTVFY
jgi:hypothetical protein